MPQQLSSRKDPSPHLKVLDKETKRARGALSCAECRRLKLKCDKTVPCASCKRRGCSAICPNGSLITGQGTRFVLADTEKLHQKIAQMSDRIRQLEDAVAILQSTLSSEPHPLLSRELLKVKSSIELHAAIDDQLAAHSAGAGGASASASGGTRKQDPEEEEESVMDAFGTLAIRDDGAATFYGRSAGSESLLIGEVSPREEQGTNGFHEPQPLPSASSSSTAAAAAAALLHHQQYSPPSTASQVYRTLHSAHISPHIPNASMNNNNLAFPLQQPTSPVDSIAALSASFPLSTNALQNITIDMDYLLVHFLPKWEDTSRLAQLYLEQAPWFFGAVTRRQLVEEMLPMWYYEARGGEGGVNTTTTTSPSPGLSASAAAPAPLTPISPIEGGGHGVTVSSAAAAAINAASPGSYSTTSSSSTTSSKTTRKPSSSQQPSQPPQQPNRKTTRTAHDLALLFMVLCFGALTDITLPAAPDNPLSEEYYQLTKAALVLEPVLERPPSVATVQALSLMAIYEGICSRDGSVERTWGLFGLAVKLAQSIGLHRDCARWKLSPAEVQKRRALFWELFITDCWQSLATGRLATFSLPFVDCELPADPDSTIAPDGTIQPSFPFWKARFGAECVSAVVQGTLTSRAPKYSIILDLDRKVRDMEVPLYAQQFLAATEAAGGTAAEGAAGGGEGVGLPVGMDPSLGLGETMSRFMPINYRELTLLYIHRCFFAHAISTHPSDPIKSQYAPSFLAGYRSACMILASVKQQFMLFPKQIARFWVLWTHAFSATVMLSSVATHVSKQGPVAHAALIELNNACELFEQAAGHGGRAVKFLPILKRLRAKAQKSFQDSERGIPASIPNDILKPSKTDDEKNELEIFGGKTHTVATTRPTTTSTSGGGGVSSKSSPSRANSGSPQAISPGLQQRQQQGQQQQQASAQQTYSQPGVDPFQQQVPMQLYQQEQLMTQYPSFEGVHPGLVHELHGFGGRIEAQVRQAYMEGATGVGVGVDVTAAATAVGGGEERDGMVGVEFQHQQQQQGRDNQLDYEQQHQQQIRREAERRQREERRAERERERLREQQQERERSEQRERHEYEMQRARQQQQQQYQPPPPPPGYPQQQQLSPPQYAGYYDESGIPPPPPPAPSSSSSVSGRRVSRYSPPLQSGLRHSYPPPQEAMYQHPQQHQPLHVIPPQYIAPPPRSELDTPSSSTMSGQQTPITPYDMQQGAYPPPPSAGGGGPQPYSQHPGPPPPPPQQQQHGYSPYWAAAPNVQEHGYPTQHHSHPQYSAQYSSTPQHHQPPLPPPQASYTQQHPQHPQQNYTPGGVLRGIAADDSRLQETWTSYMYDVASPKPYFED